MWSYSESFIYPIIFINRIMVKQIFKYLVPAYIVWFVGHIIFFISLFFSQIGKGNNLESIDLILVGLLFLSHILIVVCSIAFMVYMIVDCAMRKFDKDSQKILWIVIIVLTSFLGAIIYYYKYGKNPRK